MTRRKGFGLECTPTWFGSVDDEDTVDDEDRGEMSDLLLYESRRLSVSDLEDLDLYRSL